MFGVYYIVLVYQEWEGGDLSTAKKKDKSSFYQEDSCARGRICRELMSRSGLSSPSSCSSEKMRILRTSKARDSPFASPSCSSSASSSFLFRKDTISSLNSPKSLSCCSMSKTSPSQGSSFCWRRSANQATVNSGKVSRSASSSVFSIRLEYLSNTAVYSSLFSSVSSKMSQCVWQKASRSRWNSVSTKISSSFPTTASIKFVCSSWPAPVSTTSKKSSLSSSSTALTPAPS
mmetsp:Transcript_35589/g.77411  ORF Transcript_35589/g.77411 Transcript_35589/m.77411 type:complete len:232 (+) Transcript_35589:1087-1782(+)